MFYWVYNYLLTVIKGEIMGDSVLVFISHSSNDKESFIEPLVNDLESCYINVWLDKKKIIPGENLRKSIFKEGINKSDIALIFFTENSLESSWVDSEIKHVLREEKKKGNDFDINKIISIFDSQETYDKIYERYPELTDDLFHLMPEDYSKIQFGQLLSAIWSKYLTLQGGDVEIQRQLLAKDKEIFKMEKDIQILKQKLNDIKLKNNDNNIYSEFESIVKSGTIKEVIDKKDIILSKIHHQVSSLKCLPAARAIGIVQLNSSSSHYSLTPKGIDFLKWYLMKEH